MSAGEAFIAQKLAVTGQVSRVDFSISLDTCDKDMDGMLDFWEHRRGLSWTNRLDAALNPDADPFCNLHEYWLMGDPWVANTNANYAIIDAIQAVDAKIAGLIPTNSIRMFSVQDHAATNYVRNTNCWAAAYDITCCSPWNSYSGHLRAGTLISPRHVLFAAHFDEIPTNHVLRFVDRQNNVIERKLIAKKQHPLYPPGAPYYYPDLTVGLLDSDVPTNQITFAKVLPDNYAEYIRDGRYLPALRLDQEEKALIGDVWSVAIVYPPGTQITASCNYEGDPLRYNYFEPLFDGDSGNPAFLLLRSQPILLTVWTGINGGYGTSVTAFKRDINTLMLDLDPGGYQLTEIDLSGFKKLGD